jgi:hypothetical protein
MLWVYRLKQYCVRATKVTQAVYIGVFAASGFDVDSEEQGAKSSWAY